MTSTGAFSSAYSFDFDTTGRRGAFSRAFSADFDRVPEPVLVVIPARVVYVMKTRPANRRMR
jgi:hypothetical protein